MCMHEIYTVGFVKVNIYLRQYQRINSTVAGPKASVLVILNPATRHIFEPILSTSVDTCLHVNSSILSAFQIQILLEVSQLKLYMNLCLSPHYCLCWLSLEGKVLHLSTRVAQLWWSFAGLVSADLCC